MTFKDLLDIGPPPLVRKVPGLYYLIKESPQVIINKKMLETPEQCIAALKEMEVNGELSHKLMAAIEPWIHWRRAQLVSNDVCSDCVIVCSIEC